MFTSLNLKNNVVLKELVIFFYSPYPVGLVTHLLSTITSPHLTTVIFTFYFNKPGVGFSSDEWRAIEKTLARLCKDRSQHLRIITDFVVRRKTYENFSSIYDEGKVILGQ